MQASEADSDPASGSEERAVYEQGCSCPAHSEPLSIYCRTCKRGFCDKCPPHDAAHLVASLFSLPMPEEIDKDEAEMKKVLSETVGPIISMRILHSILSRTSKKANDGSSESALLNILKNRSSRKSEKLLEFLDDLWSFESTIDARLRALVEIRDDVKSNYDQEVERAFNEVNNFYSFDTEKVKKQITSEIETIGKKLEEYYEPYLDQLNIKNELKACVQLISSAVGEGNEEEKAKFIERVEKVLDEEHTEKSGQKIKAERSEEKSEETKEGMMKLFIEDVKETIMRIAEATAKNIKRLVEFRESAFYFAEIKNGMSNMIEIRKRKLIEEQKRSLVYKSEKALSSLRMKDKAFALESIIACIDKTVSQKRGLEKSIAEFEGQVKAVCNFALKLRETRIDSSPLAIDYEKFLAYFNEESRAEMGAELIENTVVKAKASVASISNLISSIEKAIDEGCEKIKTTAESSHYDVKALHELMDNAIVQGQRAKAYLEKVVEKRGEHSSCVDGRMGRVKLKCGHYICAGCVRTEKINDKTFYCIGCGGKRRSAGRSTLTYSACSTELRMQDAPKPHQAAGLRQALRIRLVQERYCSATVELVKPLCRNCGRNVALEDAEMLWGAFDLRLCSGAVNLVAEASAGASDTSVEKFKEMNYSWPCVNADGLQLGSGKQGWIASNIFKNSSVTSIVYSMVGVRVDSERTNLLGMDMLRKIVHYNTSLRKLSLRISPITVDGTPLNAEGMRMLCEVLTENTSLTLLNLCTKLSNPSRHWHSRRHSGRTLQHAEAQQDPRHTVPQYLPLILQAATASRRRRRGAL